MTRFPGDQSGLPPTPHNFRDQRGGGLDSPFNDQQYADTSNSPFNDQRPHTMGPQVQPPQPAPPTQPTQMRPAYSAPAQPMPQMPQMPPIQPQRAGGNVMPGDETNAFQDRGQYQLAPGTMLQNGRYLIETVIGKGGMGHVYRGRDTRLNRVRAIKEMIPKLGDPSPTASISNYEREAQVMLALENPNIPDVYDTFVENGRAYIVIQFINGENLEQRLKHTQGFLSEQQVGAWMIQLCQIVSYLHRHDPPIIFRDIKPNNIIVTPAPENRIVLIDFGIAKSFMAGEKHTNVGTTGYAAKEQYTGEAEPRSDVYSIGATMHHLLTGSDPREFAPFTFTERMPRQLNPAISQATEAVIMKAVAHEKENRYQSADELARAIEGALGVISLDDTGIFRIAQPHGAPMPAPWTPPSGPTSTVHAGAMGTEKIWAFQTGDEVRSTPVLSGDTLYIGSYDHQFYAIDRRTGGLRWRYATGAGICGRGALWRDLVFFGSEDGYVYALNAQTGGVVWRFQTGRQVRSSPRIFNDTLFVGSDDASIYALDPRTGTQRWRYSTYGEIRSSASFARATGVVIFGSNDGNVYAVDAQSGDKKWAFRSNGPIISSPIADGDHVYVASADFSVYCLETKSGWRAWEERTDKFVTSSPTLTSDYLYIGSTDTHLYCLNRRTGRRQWRYHSNNQINSTPFIAGDTVYFGSNDCSFYGLDVSTGNLRWRFETNGIAPGSPVVDQGVVYAGSGDGFVYALRAATS